MRIYLITNEATGMSYVGQTRWSLKNRWQWHREHARDNSRIYALQRAIRAHGEENFTICELAAVPTMQQAIQLELLWTLTLGTFEPNGYNVRAGYRFSDAARKRSSIYWKGRPKPYLRGHMVSPETIEKIRQANIGRKLSPEIRAKMREAKRLKPKSAEHRAKLSALMSAMNKARWAKWREEYPCSPR